MIFFNVVLSPLAQNDGSSCGSSSSPPPVPLPVLPSGPKIWNRCDEPTDPAMERDFYSKRLVPCWVMASQVPFKDDVGGAALLDAMNAAVARAHFQEVCRQPSNTRPFFAFGNVQLLLMHDTTMFISGAMLLCLQHLMLRSFPTWTKPAPPQIAILFRTRMRFSLTGKHKTHNSSGSVEREPNTTPAPPLRHRRPLSVFLVHRYDDAWFGGARTKRWRGMYASSCKASISSTWPRSVL